MSIVRARTKSYGPALLDIQIEQGADFYLPFELSRGGSPWDLTNCTLEAHFSLAWSPGEACVDLEVIVKDALAGTCKIKFPAASSLNLVLPSPPRKTVEPSVFQLGGWVFNVTDPSITDCPTKRMAEGIVQMDRDPCLA